MPILKLIPACKDYIWGGDRLKREYRKDFYPGDRLAETWELSCHPDGLSVIENGETTGQTLKEYLTAHPEATGTACAGFPDFPVLIKFIDAAKPLSVQVHPDDAYARKNEGQNGKTEMWYVLAAEPGAFLYYGFRKAVSEEEFRTRIGDGTLTEILNAVPVKAGDRFFIPAGTVHAIGAGIVIAEIQQNSNVTYRVYDYGRPGADGKPRPLHVEKAIAVTERIPPRETPDFGGHLAQCPYFTVDEANAPCAGNCDGTSFVSVLAVDGEGTLICGGDTVVCRKGDSFFLPAGSGEFALSGTVRALISRVARPAKPDE